MNDLLDGIITNLIVKFFLRFIAPYPIQLILGIMAIYWGYYTYYVKRGYSAAGKEPVTDE